MPSMVIGAPAVAVNCAVRVCVGKIVAQQPKGSCVIGPLAPAHTGAVPKPRVVMVSRRASAKYAWLSALLFVTVIGTMSGPPLTETLWVGLFGSPVAFTCAV